MYNYNLINLLYLKECKISPTTRHDTLPECACFDKFYDDGSSVDCLPCLDICAKCVEGEYCTGNLLYNI